jgi:hypothetical protein
MNPFTKIRDLLWRATRQWISAIGVLLTTLAAIGLLSLFAIELSGKELGNYAGILSYVILPGIFVFGLLLIPIGLYRLRKLEKAGKAIGYPVLNFNEPRLRGMALIVVAVTGVNLMLVSTATFKGLEVMHSNQFCGATCHNTMQPEAVAHSVTPHAKVYCADCHVGEGAGHFAKAKLRGATQMLQFFADDIDRPIPQPTTEVASEICTRCHATERFTEDRLHVRKMYSDDEKAAEKTTVYRMRVGGLRDGKWQGVHKHNGLNIRYRSDPKRLSISDIEVTRADGSVETFTSKDIPAGADARWHTMGCTDCHNRPAHKFFTPKSIVEKALGRGAIDKELPFIGREAVLALTATYPSHDAAKAGIPAALAAFYAKQLPTQDEEGKAKVQAAGALLATEWTHNNFPDMKVGWGTYRDFLQHEPGCYRCHDKNHANAKGQVIQQKCTGTCHDMIATEEEQPEAMDVLYP